MITRRGAIGMGAATIALGASTASQAQRRGAGWRQLRRRRIVRVSLLGAHGLYAVAEPDGRANANRRAASLWETWTLIRYANGSVSFLGAHGMFLVAEPDGRAEADRAEVGAWEVFEPVVRRRGVGFRGAHGMFLVAEPDGRLRADRRAMNDWETFRVAPSL